LLIVNILFLLLKNSTKDDILICNIDIY
jgi:hypothetical protein